MKTFLKISFALTIFIVFLVGCKPQIQPDQITGTDISQAELAISDVFSFSTSETSGEKLSDTSFYSVETIINSDTTRTTKITFDTTCVFEDGVVRGGQIIIDWTLGWLWDSTKVTTVSFNQFSRNGNILSGELELRFLRGSQTDLGKPTHEIIEKNMSIELANNQGTTTWDGTRTVQWESGILTIANKTDDVKLVELFKDGVNRNGEHYIAEGEDLRVDHTCSNGTKITSGILIITKDDGTEATIDFGDGECDNNFTVTQEGQTVQITP